MNILPPYAAVNEIVMTAAITAMISAQQEGEFSDAGPLTIPRRRPESAQLTAEQLERAP